MLLQIVISTEFKYLEQMVNSSGNLVQREVVMVNYVVLVVLLLMPMKILLLQMN
uniref:Uncharacterized protein n=1 Tax=Arcella intermedia TaxID=1963864 RepID=A0A6B2LVS2_9EUKA